METRFYHTQDIDLQQIGPALVQAYQTQGYEAQQVGTQEQVVIQLRRESTLRTITGFNKGERGVPWRKLRGGSAATLA